MSADLAQRLQALGAEIDFPPTPDVVPGVLARLPDGPGRRGLGQRLPGLGHRLPGLGLRPSRYGLGPRRASLRMALVALAILCAVASAAMAVPSTRHAILRLLGLRGVRIERVGHLPPVPTSRGTRLGLGRPISLAGARHAADFTALLPPGPAIAYVGRDVPGGRISLLVGRELIIEFRATTIPFLFKLIGPETRVERLRVDGGPGVYLSGAPHQLLFETANGSIRPDTVRLAGNVLVWQERGLTIRIEGAGTLAHALALARSLR